MSVDFDCGAVDSGYDFFDLNGSDQGKEDKFGFREKIFSPPYYPVSFSKEAAVNFHRSQELQKTDALVKELFRGERRECVAGSQVNKDIDISIVYDGKKLELDASVRLEDKNGNYVEGSLYLNSDGDCRADGSAGSPPDKD